MLLFPRRKSNNRKSNNRKSVARACFEVLESRRLLTAAVWTGAGTDALFSDAANWQGNVAPSAGDDITFPAGVTNTNVTVDSNITTGTIQFNGNYALTPLNAGSDSITSGANVYVNGAVTIGTPILLGQTTTITTFPGGSATLDGVISDGGNAYGLDVQGTGSVIIAGNGDTYTGQTTVDGGTVTLVTNLASNVSVTPGSTFVGTDSVASVDDNGGTLSPDNNSNPGNLSLADNLTFEPGSGATLDVLLDGANDSSKITVASGTIALGDATLSGSDFNSYAPHSGDVITLIANNTGNAVTGTFNGLPEGATTTIGNENYTISYLGGSSGHDVTLTAGKAAATVTLTSSHTPVYVGHTVTLTATVAGTDANSDPITGTVTFYDDGVAIGSAQPLSNGTVTINDTTLPVGSDSITASYSGDTNFAAATTSAPVIATVRANTAGTVPTIVSATSSASTHGFTIAASVVGADTSTAGAAGLKYTWTAIHLPSGAKTPTFSANGTNAAKTITARFSKDGGYVLQCKVTNAAGNSVTTNVAVTVSQKATSIKLEPHKADIAKGGTEQFTATVLDQFSHPMRTAQTVTYLVEAGRGSISSTGLFSAGSIASAVTIEAKADELTGTVGALVA